MDGGLEGPCNSKAKINIFPMNDVHLQSECMNLCKKLGGRSSSVQSMEEWKNLLEEIKYVSPAPSKLPPHIWTSATEGVQISNGSGLKLSAPRHWPDGTKAKEGVWRDYYTGEQLGNYTKPWLTSHGDRDKGVTYNCIRFESMAVEARSWHEWNCAGLNMGCPCTYDTPPLIRLRGFCSDTLVEHLRYTVKQSSTDPGNIILVGQTSAKIQYDSSFAIWELRDSRFNVTARSRASQNSFALGKHNWIISGDSYQCFEGKDYSSMMKFTGCNEAQFTCDDGQCGSMEERCNQITDCRDKSDELNCQILELEEGYNMRVPPIETLMKGNVRTLKPVEVKVAMTLYKVVAIEEEDHSIELQFQISLEWKENRATFYNLKTKPYLNALSGDEIQTIWLPLIVYMNTDQHEPTRLGWVDEWSTDVNIKREGIPTRNGYEMLDEAYVFKGEENSVVMTQSYTHEFQCVYQLEIYPFDTQVTE